MGSKQICLMDSDVKLHCDLQIQWDSWQVDTISEKVRFSKIRHILPSCIWSHWCQPQRCVQGRLPVVWV